MEREYPVPGFEKDSVTEDGKVYSYYGKGGSRKQLKEHRVYKHSKHRVYIYFALQIPGTRKKKQVNLPRLMLACKLGRWLEPWEQARHLNGDCNDNRMENLAAGCVVLNMLDDLEAGTRETSVEYIDEAIMRLTQLKDKLKMVPLNAAGHLANEASQGCKTCYQVAA